MQLAPTDAVAFHSEIAAEFHASYRTDPNRRERIKVWCDFIDRYGKGAQLAYDMGCGSGILTCELAARRIETIGIDGSADMLAIARDTVRERRVSAVFNKYRLPISDTTNFRSADLIISSSVIEYLEDPVKALKCFRDLMNARATIIFSVSNHDSLSRKLVRLVHRFTGRPRYLSILRHFMTENDIRSVLQSAHLVYVEHAYFGSADRLNRVLAWFVPKRLASNMIIVVARRD